MNFKFYTFIVDKMSDRPCIRHVPLYYYVPFNYNQQHTGQKLYYSVMPCLLPRASPPCYLKLQTSLQKYIQIYLNIIPSTKNKIKMNVLTGSGNSVGSGYILKQQLSPSVNSCSMP